MEFPEDVLVNILGRLPIKDVSSFKCVCKSWCTLISDPYFNSYYIRNSPFTIIYREDDCNDLSLSLLEFAWNGDCTVIPFTPKLPESAGFCFHLTVIGTRDCSVFFVAPQKTLSEQVAHRFFLFNPVLGSCVKVADNSFEFYMEYKIGIIPSKRTYVDENLLFWGAFDYEQVITFLGAYHWLSIEYDDTICSFDLLKIKCGVGIPLPHGVSRLSRKTTRLTIVNDCLSVADRPDDSTMVIWTMKEYGVVESWSRDFILTLCNVPQEKWSNFPLPVAVFPNGNILFLDNSGKGTYIYNLQEKRLTEIEEKRLTKIEHQNSTFFSHFVNKYAPRFFTFKLVEI